MYKKQDLIEKSIVILNQNPAITFFDLCKELEISRVTAYKYFADKDELIFQICDYVLDKKSRFLSDIDDSKDAVEILKDIIYYFSSTVESYFFLYSYASIMGDEDLERKYYSHYTDIWEYVTRIIWDNEADVTWQLYHLDGLIYAGYYAYRDEISNIDQISESIYKSFMNDLNTYKK